MLKNIAALVLVVVLPTWSSASSEGFRNMVLALRQLVEFTWTCVTLPWRCGAWVVHQVRCWRMLIILAALVTASGSPRADTPEVEARRCSAILDMLAESQVAGALDIASAEGAPDAKSHEPQTRYLEGKLAETFARTGAVVGREKLPDLMVDGSPALVVTERWIYAGGLSSYFGCVRYAVADEMTTSFSFDDDLKAITDDLSRLAREPSEG